MSETSSPSEEEGGEFGFALTLKLVDYYYIRMLFIHQPDIRS